MEEKVYKTNKVSLDLSRQLKDSKVEIDMLKEYVLELKNRQTAYIPVKDDPVDCKLASYLNGEYTAFKASFIRES